MEEKYKILVHHVIYVLMSGQLTTSPYRVIIHFIEVLLRSVTLPPQFIIPRFQRN